jgi:hypothetical protein
MRSLLMQTQSKFFSKPYPNSIKKLVNNINPILKKPTRKNFKSNHSISRQHKKQDAKLNPRA